MDKFQFVKEEDIDATTISGQIKDVHNGWQYKQCVTWFPSTNELKTFNCFGNDSPQGIQNRWNHERDSGRICLKHFPSKCLSHNGINNRGLLSVVDVEFVDAVSTTPAPQTNAPETAYVWYEIDNGISSFGTI